MDSRVRSKIVFGQYPDVLVGAVILEVTDAQEVQVRSGIPLIRQRFRYWSSPSKKNIHTGFVIGEVRETDDYFLPDAEGLVEDKIDLNHLLHALVQDNVIKGLIGVFGQTRIDIPMEYAHSSGDAFVDL